MTKKIAGIILLAGFLIFWGSNANAQCCVLSNGSCETASEEGEPCPNGGDIYDSPCASLTDQCNSSTIKTVSFINPLEFNTVEEILTSLLTNLRGIIVVLSIIFIVIGAILYITSAGREKQTTLAKNAILASMIGLAIGIAAPSFLKEISKILGWNTSNSDVSGALTLAEIALNTLNFLLSIVGILAIIMLVVGGITYLTAAGDDDKIKMGKSIFKWSVIGITLALASMVIVRQIAAFFQ